MSYCSRSPASRSRWSRSRCPRRRPGGHPSGGTTCIFIIMSSSSNISSSSSSSSGSSSIIIIISSSSSSSTQRSIRLLASVSCGAGHTKTRLHTDRAVHTISCAIWHGRRVTSTHFWAHGVFNLRSERGTSVIVLAGATLARPYRVSRGRRNAFRIRY